MISKRVTPRDQDGGPRLDVDAGHTVDEESRADREEHEKVRHRTGRDRVRWWSRRPLRTLTSLFGSAFDALSKVDATGDEERRPVATRAPRETTNQKGGNSRPIYESLRTSL